VDVSGVREVPDSEIGRDGTNNAVGSDNTLYRRNR
jgi:hypothetical protein